MIQNLRIAFVEVSGVILGIMAIFSIPILFLLLFSLAPFNHEARGYISDQWANFLNAYFERDLNLFLRYGVN